MKQEPVPEPPSEVGGARETTSRIKRTAGIVLGLAVVAFVGRFCYRVASFQIDPHGQIASAYRSLDLPHGMTYTREELSGTANCLFGDCAAVTRVYTTSHEAAAACGLMIDAIRTWPVEDLHRQRQGECAYRGRKGNLFVNADVSAGVADGEADDGLTTVTVTLTHR